MRTRAVLLSLLVLGAGCLGSDAPGQDQGSQEDQEPDSTQGQPLTVTRTLVFEGDVSAGTESERVGVNGTATLGTGLDRVTLDLSWGQGTNRFAAHALAPGGEEHTLAPDVVGCCASGVSGEVQPADPGLWRFYVTAEGSHVPDHVKLKVQATWTLPANGTAAPTETPRVHTERVDDGWRAWRTLHENGTVGESVEVTADATNGALNVTTGATEVSSSHGTGLEAGLPVRADRLATSHANDTSVRVRVHAHGDTEEEARQRVLSVNVDIRIEEDSVEATSNATNWSKRGVDTAVWLPPDASPSLSLDVTNGPVQVQAASVRGAQVDATNGPIRGSLSGSGSIQLDAVNGKIGVDLEPLDPADLEVDATNAQVTMGLVERDEIGYVIDAEATNGHLTESMEEARLEGSSDDATLRTDNADQRNIQVTGTTDVTNGNVHFAGR